MLINLRYSFIDSDVKDINNFMNAFEAFIHPKNLFFIIPAGIFTYWAMTSYVPSFFKKVPLRHFFRSSSFPTSRAIPSVFNRFSSFSYAIVYTNLFLSVFLPFFLPSFLSFLLSYFPSVYTHLSIFYFYSIRSISMMAAYPEI